MRFSSSGLKAFFTSRITRFLISSYSTRERLAEADAGVLTGDVFAADIGGTDDDGVDEADRAPFAVGQPSVVQDLEQKIEDVAVGLFDLVQKKHRVRVAPHLFGKLTAFAVAHIAGRRSDELGDGVTLHILAHVQANEPLFVVEQELGQCLGQLGLSYTGRSEKDEGADGTFLSL